VRVVHFVNQFFGGLGGEEKANLPVQVVAGPAGPGGALQQALGKEPAIVATVIGGDDYINEETPTVIRAVKQAQAEHRPDLVVAGPAMNVGRYGLACGDVSASSCDREFRNAIRIPLEILKGPYRSSQNLHSAPPLTRCYPTSPALGDRASAARNARRLPDRDVSPACSAFWRNQLREAR